MEEDGDTLKIGTIYGDKTCAYGDAVMERCKVCKGTEHMVYDELIGADVELAVKPEDRFAKVKELEAMRRSVLPSGRASSPSASAATPAGTCVRPAAATSACSTATASTPPRRPTRTPLRSRCSI